MVLSDGHRDHARARAELRHDLLAHPGLAQGRAHSPDRLRHPHAPPARRTRAGVARWFLDHWPACTIHTSRSRRGGRIPVLQHLESPGLALRLIRRRAPSLLVATAPALAALLVAPCVAHAQSPASPDSIPPDAA